jgi:hypothetical protein
MAVNFAKLRAAAGSQCQAATISSVELPTRRHALKLSRSALVVMGACVKSQRTSFHCPHCDALYELIKVEAGSETVDRQITCRACGGPLPGREGHYILKYFMLRKAGRRQVWRRSPAAR